jgi:hypothetical protein
VPRRPPDVEPPRRIERRGGLVEEEQGRIQRERARDGDAVRLAARQFPRAGVAPDPG